MSQEEKARISLLYAFMGQIFEALPGCLELTVDCSEEGLDSFDGPRGASSKAAELFRDLLSPCSGIAYCVIDAFHWLDSSSTDVLVAELLELMLGEPLKVLFTPSGELANH